MTLHFNSKCISVDFKVKSLDNGEERIPISFALSSESGSDITIRTTAGFIIGADGANSLVRNALSEAEPMLKV